MNDNVTIVRVPTGLRVPESMQLAQDRLLGRFGDVPKAINLQDVVDNPNSALIFALVGSNPQSGDDWAAVPAEAYAGTVTLLILQTTVHNVGHIYEIVVESGHEGQGIGRQLMQGAIEIGRDNGISRFDLTSRPDKLAAQALYEKTGFKKRETNNWRLEI
jgi:ribosomal protein S18 acetylase RimI-like enzyme